MSSQFSSSSSSRAFGSSFNHGPLDNFFNRDATFPKTTTVVSQSMSPETNKPRKRQRYCENEEEVEDQHNSSQSETELSFSDTFNLLQSTIANLCSLLKRKDEKIMLLEQQQQKEEQKNNYQNELPSIGNMEKTDSLFQKEEEIRALQIKVSHLESTIQKEETLRKEHEDLLFSQSAKLTEATRQQQLQQQNNQKTTAVLFREEISRLQLELNQEKEKYQNVVLTCTQLKEALRKKTQKSDAADTAGAYNLTLLSDFSQ
mmetsp:Transcript_9459/g.13649  ORF Transcript_9459/g.13649 Transcript_9459/m.13649 type:complete len:259 (-) Transcript_9459:282-1058(-)